MADYNNNFDVLIIGGSYAGLSAALALGRALRKVLIIDSGLPCNRQTPHSHNFLTNDGEKPAAIAQKAKAEVLNYDTVQFMQGIAVSGTKLEHGFAVTTDNGTTFTAQKIIFATGVKDLMPSIPGFSECWGASVIHCPYCHGYEVHSQKTGILANGEFAFHYARLLRNWTKDLVVFTNGPAELSDEQRQKIKSHHIPIIEKEIASLNHENGQLRDVVFSDGSAFALNVLYARPSFGQHCNIPELLGCELTDQGFLKVDMFQKTTVEGVYACGDNAQPMRSVANAVASGNMAAAVLNNDMIAATF